MGINDIDILKPGGGSFAFFWPYPDNSMMTDEAVSGMVGQKMAVNQGTKTIRGRVVKAVNQKERSGVELTIEYGRIE